MGGNAKHMPHVWEHYDSTFGEIISLFESLTTGQINVTEKFDGVNIHFRVDNSGVVRFSRSGPDLRAGGFTFAEALDIYENHPAKETFIEGLRAIDEQFTNAWWPFGYSGKDWINAEIVASFREQLLRYDENAIVLHQLVTFLPAGKKLIDPVKQTRLNEFSRDNFHTVKDIEWKVLSPVRIELSNDSGFGYLSEATDRLEKCMRAASLNESNTLREFLRHSLLVGPLSKIRTSQIVKEKLADKISGVDPTIRLVDIKKGQPAGIAEEISFYGQKKNENRHHRAAMRPIINAVDAFASARLQSLNSMLIENQELEQNRIMQNIQNDAKIINEVDDGYKSERVEMFNALFNDWKQVTQGPAAIEGLTFEFAGAPTKITGGFATLNQLLGITRYGRGGIPAIDESTQRKNIAPTISPEWFTLK